jgi:hypothetical protein
MSTTPFDPAACKRITTEQRCECNEAGEAERAGMAGMKALNLAIIDRGPWTPRRAASRSIAWGTRASLASRSERRSRGRRNRRSPRTSAAP